MESPLVTPFFFSISILFSRFASFSSASNPLLSCPIAYLPFLFSSSAGPQLSWGVIAFLKPCGRQSINQSTNQSIDQKSINQQSFNRTLFGIKTNQKRKAMHSLYPISNYLNECGPKQEDEGQSHQAPATVLCPLFKLIVLVMWWGETYSAGYQNTLQTIYKYTLTII